MKVMKITTKPAENNIMEVNEKREQAMIAFLQGDQSEEEKINEKKQFLKKGDKSRKIYDPKQAIQKQN